MIIIYCCYIWTLFPHKRRLLSSHSSSFVTLFTDSRMKSALVSTFRSLETRNDVAFPFRTWNPEIAPITYRRKVFSRGAVLTRITSSSLLSSPAKNTLTFPLVQVSPKASSKINFAASPKRSDEHLINSNSDYSASVKWGEKCDSETRIANREWDRE